ncbi:hypothetical protein DBR45_00300 [Pseudomonas sp. HMWF031]|nr:hypothetical protein DBR45_00300 [Pseudomonas sp. HMWF031]
MECKLCAHFGEVDCSKCGKAMPAGYGHECVDCYYDRTFHKRVKINIEALSTNAFRDAYSAYGEWLIKRVGAKRAALLINRHLKSFMEMNVRWKKLPSYRQLLESFGAQWIRRARLPMQWMTDECALQVDEELKADLTELRRIESVIASMPSDAGQKLLSEYRKHIESKPNKRRNSSRSVRMALRSAANLLLVSAATGQTLPSSKSLRSLLAETPGVAASLTSFVSFLNTKYSLGLEFPKDNRDAVRQWHNRFEQEIKVLMSEASMGIDVLDRWPTAALGYFHRVTKLTKAGMTLTPDAEQKGMLVSLKGKEYWIPIPSPAKSI